MVVDKYGNYVRNVATVGGIELTELTSVWHFICVHLIFFYTIDLTIFKIARLLTVKQIYPIVQVRVFILSFFEDFKKFIKPFTVDLWCTPLLMFSHIHIFFKQIKVTILLLGLHMQILTCCDCHFKRHSFEKRSLKDLRTHRFLQIAIAFSIMGIFGYDYGRKHILETFSFSLREFYRN
jgi:hypothetical protein